MNPDLVLPFQLDIPQLRGRLVRLGPVLDAIIQRHDYPLPVATLLTETITLAALLAGMLKYDGIFTLQAKGDGIVTSLVVDLTSSGALRAHARFNPEHLADLPTATDGIPLTARELLGNGYLAFTVDQRLSDDRYQGIVELNGDTLVDFVQHYFRQSEQIETGFEIAVSCGESHWQAGGIMLQRLPEAANQLKSDEEDDWRRAMILLDSVRPEELTNPALTPHDLLFRLFHEEEVRVFEPYSLEDKCRCSRERVASMLRALPAEEIEALKTEGSAQIKCEFCSQNYVFSAEQLTSLKKDD